MSSRWRRFWWTLGLLSGLSLLAAFAISTLHGHVARQVLRERIVQLRPLTGPALELQELSAAWRSSHLRLALWDRSPSLAALVLEVDLSHRFLATRFTGRLRLRPASAGTPVPLARLHGLLRLDPLARHVDWSAQLLGRPVELAQDGRRLQLAPWSARLRTPAAAHLSLTLPQLRLTAPAARQLVLQGVELDLNLAPGSLAGELRLAGLELRAAPVALAVDALALQARGRRQAEGWSVTLGAAASELVYQGIPFTRLRALSFAGHGMLTPEPEHARDLAWRSHGHLTAASDYGKLDLEASANGQARLAAQLGLSQAGVSGELPLQLWSVLERLTPALARELRDAGLVQIQPRQLRLQAHFQRDTWSTLPGTDSTDIE